MTALIGPRVYGPNLSMTGNKGAGQLNGDVDVNTPGDPRGY